MVCTDQRVAGSNPHRSGQAKGERRSGLRCGAWVEEPEAQGFLEGWPWNPGLAGETGPKRPLLQRDVPKIQVSLVTLGF